jgi:tRNA threonylcarbamoyladenosine biosynthesis protein TsaB
VRILGIETATSVCAAAVVADGDVRAEELVDGERVHAGRLMPLVDLVLRRSEFRLQDLQGVAVSIGPGSFTGLRIGLSVAKGLVYAGGMPLVAVPTLEALARHAIDSSTARLPRFVLAAIDARRDEIYCQLFEQHRNRLSSLWDARDLAVGALEGLLPDDTVLVTGNASSKIAHGLSHGGGGRTDPLRFAAGDQSRCSGASVALLGEERLLSGEVEDPSALEPRYIKEFFLHTQP